MTSLSLRRIKCFAGRRGNLVFGRINGKKGREDLKPRYKLLTAGVCLLIGVLPGFLFEKALPATPFSLKSEEALRQMERIGKKGSNPRPSEVEIPQEAMGNLDLFILAGQSNMTGQGEIDPGDVEIEPRAFVFGNNYRWRMAREPIDDPSGPVDPVSENIGAGYSCGTSFAKTYIKNHPRRFIGLIPCAKNGSSIQEWQRNLSENSLYGSCLKRALAASPMGKIKGLLFFQGETDALAPALDIEKAKFPFRWREKFSGFVRSFRKDLRIRDLPVVFAQIGTNKDRKSFKNWKAVQQEQSRVRLPGCRMIKTDDLPLKDEVHLDNEGYRILGERFGLAMTELTPKR